MSNYPVEGAPLMANQEKAYPPPGPYPPVSEQPPPYAPPQGMPPPGAAPPGYQGYPPQNYPPPQGYPQPYPVAGQPQPIPVQPATVIVQPSVVVANAASYGQDPINVICPYCHSNIVTSTEYSTGTLAWLLMCVLFFIGCWPFCLIPLCVDGCKDVTHRCPSCQKSLGYFNRM